MRVWRRLTLLQRFTIVSAGIAVALAVGLSTATVRTINAFAVEDEGQAATEVVLRTMAPQLRPEDFRKSLPPERRRLLDAVFKAHGLSDQVLRVRLWRTDGRLLYSNTPDADRLPPVAADLSTPGGYEAFVRARQDVEVAGTDIARVFVPVRLGGSSMPLGAFEIFYDLTVMRQRLAYVRRTIWTGVPGGLFILYISVFVLVRRASQKLLEQQRGLVAAHLGTFHALAAAIDAKDSYTGDHSSEVARLAEAVARTLGFKGEAVEEIHVAARLHDLGKIAVPDAILLKPGPLTVEELAIMRRHTEAGFAILRDAPMSDGAKLAVLHSHERWDGNGYPRGLAREAIPPAARILAVVDAYEAMTSDRPYRPGLPKDEALRRLREGSGTQFDPRVVEIFVRICERESRARHRTAGGEVSPETRVPIGTAAQRSGSH